MIATLYLDELINDYEVLTCGVIMTGTFVSKQGEKIDLKKFQLEVIWMASRFDRLMVK
jgi:hypothetical protein